MAGTRQSVDRPQAGSHPALGQIRGRSARVLLLGGMAARHDQAYVAVGFAFGTGAFQAIIGAESDSPTLEEVCVGPPPPGSLDALLREVAQSPAFFLDLRQLRESDAHWLQQERLTRETGAVFTSEEEMLQRVVPSDRYDLLAFVRETARARPTPTRYRPRH